jgi:AcrR family transcriptional regulator
LKQEVFVGKFARSNRSRPHEERKPRTGPGRPRSAAADTAILDAALRLFVERGYEGAGIEQIAKSAGVTRSTVYLRWPSREALIAEAIAQERGLAEHRAMASPMPSGAMVEAVVDSLVGIFTAPNYRKMLARLIGSVPDQPRLMAIYWKAYLVPRRTVAMEVLEGAQAEQLLDRDADPEILLDLISGAVLHRLLVDPHDCSDFELRSYLLKLLKELGLGFARSGNRKKHSHPASPKPRGELP